MALPPDDPFQPVAEGIPLVRKLVRAGCTGNKGAGGFYRGGPDAREVVDLRSGEYRPLEKPATEAARAGERDGLRALAEHPSAAGRFARRVLARSLGYAASLVPDVSGEVVSIDEAMKLGYGWSRGPFEMIDSLGAGWFRDLLAAEGLPVAPVLDALGDSTFHRVDDGRAMHFVMGRGYRPLVRAPRSGARRRLQGPRVADALQPRGEPVGYRRRCRLPGVSHQGQCARPGVDGVDAPGARQGRRASRGSRDSLRRAALFGRLQPRVRPRVHRRARVAAARRCAPRVSAHVPGRQACTVPGGLRARRTGARRRFRGAAGQRPRAGARERRARAGRAARRPGALRRRLPGDAVALDAGSPGRSRAGGGRVARVRARGDEQDRRVAGAGPAATVSDGSGSHHHEPRPAFSPMRRRAPSSSPVPTNRPRRRRYPPPERPRTMQCVRCSTRWQGRGSRSPTTVVVSRCLARVLAGGDASAGEIIDEEDLFGLEREAFLTLARTSGTAARIAHMLDLGRPLRN